MTVLIITKQTYKLIVEIKQLKNKIRYKRILDDSTGDFKIKHNKLQGRYKQDNGLMIFSNYSGKFTGGQIIDFEDDEDFELWLRLQ